MIQLLVIVYHYIDDEDKYRAGIYPTSPERLQSQLGAIAKNWQFISENDLVAAVRGEQSLPNKSCLVTFDDGLRSQYEQAVPILEERRIPAVFFFPTRHMAEKRAYRAHKVHYLLSRVEINELLSALENSYLEIVGQPLDWSQLEMSRVTGWYRYDDENTAKFKFFINHFSEAAMIEEVVDALFKQYHYEGEARFCESLYMPEEAIRYLSGHELFSIGMHTHSHRNAAQAESNEIAIDMSQNYKVLSDKIGVVARGIAYPFGAVSKELYEERIKAGLAPLGLTYGFTTEKKVNTNLESPFLLGRFGTNDISGGKRPILILKV